MINVYFLKDSLPKVFEQVDLNSNSLSFSFRNIDDPFYVGKGDSIVDLKYVDDKGNVVICGEMVAPCDGLVSRSHLFAFTYSLRYTKPVKEGDLFYTILTEQEYIDSHKSSYVIDTDEMTDDKFIAWTSVGENRNRLYKEYYPLSKGKGLVSFNVKSGKPIMLFRCQSKRCGLKKNGQIHLLFDAGVVLSYSITDVEKYHDDTVEALLSVSQNDLAVMVSKPFLLLRVDSGSSKILFSNSNERLPERIMHSLFMSYAGAFDAALQEYGFCWPQRTIKTDCGEVLQYAEDGCFVYLMADTSNGFFKIGISNNPQYREHTLQSEKPTIELLASKLYPSRTIAEAIEFALHKAFGDKRLRGEWFELSESDVNDIRLTLK